MHYVVLKTSNWVTKVFNQHTYRMPEKVFELHVECPVCREKSAKLTDYKYNIPYYGDILISVLECTRCGYTHRDVLTMNLGNPRKIIYKVEKAGDENALVVKSSYCKVEIPELGLVIEPGVYSQGYITTVEGIIEDFINILQNFFCKDSDVDLEKCKELLIKLEKAKNAEIPYTVVLYDYMGTSDIVSEKTVYGKLEEVQENTEETS
ncbi:MAG: ZPR1 zinc finger domain-containing protein [Desulfurococcaceae archaeon]